MRKAFDKNNNIVISDNAIKGEKYFCPGCGEEVILRHGKTNISHFAHKSLEDCDMFSSDMSDWHINWQNKFPVECREVIIKYTFEYEDAFTKENNLKIGKEYIHRADVCVNNYVIEFQHSTITRKEFNFRNGFYARAGYKVIWVFDFIDEFNSGKLICYDSYRRYNNNGGKWKWSNPPKFLSDVFPQENETIKIFIQYSENNNDDIGYIELITWAPINFGLADYKRFCTSYSICNYEELYDAIINNKL